ncbi:FecCD family ABC transporter permease [Macrococcus brunensis]|uniref:FecCD family ABC transporter permease n=1 Tax=Macrococcus brunensis TaxID=198483 RepID=UPI001EF1290B|nr:iron ABC transporter permease [Macrococcus brunensis]ULG72407.1 iron ABC transporter permease [Macrococcus brunensis]
MSNAYRQQTSRNGWMIFILAFMVVCFLIIDITIGAYDVSLTQLLFHFKDSVIDNLVIFNLRLPRALTCIIVGACLGVAGLYMQIILRNPIASPFTLGISSAASCGAAVSIVTGFPFIHPVVNIQLSAILFSLFCSGLMVMTAFRRQMDPKLMILFGVSLNFFFLAFQSLTQYMADEREVQKIVNWVFGSVTKANWTGVTVTTLTFIVFFTLSYRKAWHLNLMTMSDDRARSMGLNTHRFRIFIFICSSIITAVAVSYVGTIGFIGLLAPHFAKFLVGYDVRFTAPLSAVIGAAILLAASILSKSIIPGTLIPIGILTHIIGVPFMCMIALRGRS